MMTVALTRAPIFSRAELLFFHAAEQIMGMPALAPRRWTAAEVRALIQEDRPSPRYELLDGELLVTPSPVSAHQFAVDELFVTLFQYCRAQRIGRAVTSPADIELAPETIMQPDVFVVPAAAFPKGEAFQWPHVRSLLLAVEVLSPSTLTQDRVRKRDFYLANHVDEYWIVDLDARLIERWTPGRETPDLQRDQLEWRPRGATTPLVLNVRAFFDGNEGLARQ
jgi:Uma2 family endonuclease